ncbi:ABC transporter permease [Luteimicrobium sp. DT211]|uniref:ABC transporter permease n=1 Tax=Luteimicrobium sp. DT211 TaxID=3393412 RepID=UPI003CF0B198
MTTTTPAPAARAERAAVWPGRPLAGTGLLLRLALRRERVTLPVTVVVLVGTFAITIASVSTAYGTQADRDSAAATLGSNTAFRVLLGPLEHTQSVASVAQWRIGLFMLVVVGVLAAMTVVRHTRREEEAERLELVRAAPVGALAPLATGTIVAAILSLVTAAGMAGSLAAVAEAPGDGAGALAVGVQYLAIGLAGAGLGAVGAQVATVSRTATTIAVLVLVAGYALRGIGDVQDGLGWLRWLSPVGWAEEMDPFGSSSYGPALLCLALFVLGGAAAARLAVGRDVGAGIVQPRPGPADAPGLDSSLALTRRLQGASLASWAYAVGAYCFLLGLILSSADDLVGGNADAAKLIEQLGGTGRLEDVMTALILGWVGIAAAAWTVTYAAQLRAEESSGRAEVQLSTGVTRARYLGVAACVSVVGVVLILAAAGVLMGLGHAITGGTWGSAFADAVGGAAVQVPAALVVGGLVLACYAWWPRLVAAGWGVITVILLLEVVGDALNLPQWVLDLSPFTHTPRVPLDDATALPLVVLTLVAAAFYALAYARFAGAVGVRRRDVPAA